jgi:O-antigen ligase
MDSSRTARSPNRIQPLAQTSIGWVAMLWGFCVVLPVGMQYLCLFLLLILMSVSGRWRDTWKLAQREKYWSFSVFFFLGLTLLILATQEKRYPETASNLWHGFRIVLTMFVGLSLYVHEAKKALMGALASLGLMSLFVAANHMGLTQGSHQDLVKFIPEGNAWINMSILLAMLVMASTRLASIVTDRFMFGAVALIGLLALAMILLVMNQRNAFIAVTIGLICLSVAWWRLRLRYVVGAMAIVTLSSILLFQSVETLQARFNTGLLEIEQAHAGLASQNSMVVRYHMYQKTTEMIVARPLNGWGIGSWNDQWKKRTDPVLHGFNMPHNDFLWMGAQAGLGGSMAWLALMLSLCWMGWKQRGARGNIAFSMACIALISSLFNSATRDASIGLPMLYIVCSALAYSFGHRGKQI